MKQYFPPPLKITYPDHSYTLRKQTSFMKIQKDQDLYYLTISNKITLIHANTTPVSSKIILKEFESIDEPTQQIFTSMTQHIKGIHYQPLFKNGKNFLCLAYYHLLPIYLVMIQIGLNTKGYYEIEEIKDIIE